MGRQLAVMKIVPIRLCSEIVMVQADRIKICRTVQHFCYHALIYIVACWYNIFFLNGCAHAHTHLIWSYFDFVRQNHLKYVKFQTVMNVKSLAAKRFCDIKITKTIYIVKMVSQNYERACQQAIPHTTQSNDWIKKAFVYLIPSVFLTNRRELHGLVLVWCQFQDSN